MSTLTKKLLLMSGLAAMAGETAPPQSSYKGTKKIQLSAKQKKARARSKAARKARRKQR